MLVITNREVCEGETGEHAFGEGVNQKGPNELRLAHATRKGGKWKVELVPEPSTLTADNAPSRGEYRKLLKTCQDRGRHCLFYVHGFNKTFPETLEQGNDLAKRYGVEVVLFSWPSNPGGLPPVEYRRARRVAQASFGALDSAFEKLGAYTREQPFSKDALIDCEVSLNLMTYSLGNYLLQNYVTSNDYATETRIFTNVVLCQADVDSEGHAQWVGQIVAGQRVYATINENDKVLGWSESITYPRLGRTLANLSAENTAYVDFTRGEDVGNKHQVWGEVDNPVVKGFFKSVFRGLRGEDTSGLDYDARFNAYRL